MAEDGSDNPTDWKRQALCFRLIDMGLYSADQWFQDDFSLESQEVSEICFECPVRMQCLAQACDTKDDFGIWGGLPPSVRKQKGRSHNLNRLKNLKNPYLTEDPDSPYYRDNLTEGGQDGE